MKYIYLDYAATTPADKRVIKAISPYFLKIFGNPSSYHEFGIEAKKILTDSRQKVSNFFNCTPEEIIFTSGGTESENLAVKGIGFSNKKNGKHVIISAVEHASVDSSANFLEKQGFSITRIPVNRECHISVDSIESAIKDDTILVSVMYVNNEIGSIQPIQEISEMLKRVNAERQKVGKHKILFHVDGEAGSIYLDYDVTKLGVDSISVNGSKVYSIKGASALYVRKGVGVSTQICGGGQESLIRGGTENVPAIVALAEALTIAKSERVKNTEKIIKIKNRLSESLKNIVGCRINTPVSSAPNILHVTFLNHQTTDLVKKLSEHGICVSSGSACASNKKEEKSRVLEAVGFNKDEMDMSIRFSLGKQNSASDINRIIKTLNLVLVK